MKYYKYYEWDKDNFKLSSDYTLKDDSDLADALRVFYKTGGYDFFHVKESEYYASNWLDFMGELYRAIDSGKYVAKGKRYMIPLSLKKKQELIDKGVPLIFVQDVE